MAGIAVLWASGMSPVAVGLSLGKLRCELDRKARRHFVLWQL